MSLNSNELRRIIDLINTADKTPTPLVESLTEGPLNRVTNKVAAKLGSNRAKGRVQRDNLAKPMMIAFQKHIGMSGIQPTSSEVQKFLGTLGFTAPQASQIVGSNTQGTPPVNNQQDVSQPQAEPQAGPQAKSQAEPAKPTFPSVSAADPAGNQYKDLSHLGHQQNIKTNYNNVQPSNSSPSSSTVAQTTQTSSTSSADNSPPPPKPQSPPEGTPTSSPKPSSPTRLTPDQHLEAMNRKKLSQKHHMVQAYNYAKQSKEATDPTQKQEYKNLANHHADRSDSYGQHVKYHSQQLANASANNESITKRSNKTSKLTEKVSIPDLPLNRGQIQDIFTKAAQFAYSNNLLNNKVASMVGSDANNVPNNQSNKFGGYNSNSAPTDSNEPQNTSSNQANNASANSGSNNTNSNTNSINQSSQSENNADFHSKLSQICAQNKVNKNDIRKVIQAIKGVRNLGTVTDAPTLKVLQTIGFAYAKIS